MKNLQGGLDLPQMLFSLMFILLMIIACLWVVQPFILGFAWASMVVIATWPLMIKLQHLLWGRRSLAVIAMTILLLLLFIIPIAVLVNSLIDNSAPVIAWATQGHMTVPQLDWLKEVPMVGDKLFVSYHKLVDGGGSAIMSKLQPYIGRTTGFFVAQAGHFGRFMLHLGLMLLFSVLLYWRGEQVGLGIRHFAYRMGGRRGDAAVLLAGQAIRAVALGVVVTALVQGVLGGIGLAISGIPYATLLTVVMILSCLVQLGPLIVLVPAIIWLYWSGDTTWGTVLLVWSCVVGTLDNVLRPMLIRMGADLPMILILSGVIGGLVAFGMIGLFIGPVVLAVSYRLVSVWMHEAPAPDDDPETVVEELTEHDDHTA
ncbi:MAG: AI-2E family transporter YdiK [Pantoea sp.]|uniref:AI-2E family transporter n=1 Tax=Pantoea phytobeneficialis TaxID=2052056 RepID=A0AAP9H4C2_9GAMM|nr:MULTISPECIES: AI-2E family transporter YdiK [Pantoea]ERK10309.1 putative membrane protein [Pantoea sp. AS-PWVM4]MDO6406180.1 AI-2E family transporter YdiK [Pantoea phytobeneficialis]QGR06510.1 AI-2E family transporter [Pantoea phytobeneficialis]